MANKKISQLTALGTTPAVGDIIPITDVSGTPTTKSVTVANLMAAAPVQSVNSTNVTAAGALMDSEVTNLAQVKAFDSADYATAAQGTLADSATQPGDLGTAAATNSVDYATAAQGGKADTAVQPAGIVNMVETTDSIDVLADVDTSTVAPTTTDFLKWGGTNWVPAVPTADVDGPLTTALRGTDNPHIGAYPNQSFKVTDNPQKSVMVIADADGNLDFLVKSDSANIYLNTPSARKAASFGFSVVEDSTEPDIEVVGTLAGASENYSVISGDSDSLGANGLPIRQGFQNPDIGANPAPILISGGSIS